jgi:hypothetical protein
LSLIFRGAAFTAAPAGQQGDFGCNLLRGFNAAQADIGVQRVFRLTERTGASLPRGILQYLQPPQLREPD